MDEWEGIYHSVLFAQPILKWEELNSKSSPQNREDAPQFLKNDKDAQSFFDALKALHSSNSPQNHLTPFPGKNDIFILKKGGWIAYYVINQKIKKFYGLLAIREDISKQMLFERIKEARDSLGC